MKKIEKHKIDKAVELYQQGISTAKVASLSNIGHATLQRYFKKLGITRSNKQNSRKYQLNHNFFSVINNEKTAYWLGFIYADGFITIHKKHNQKNVGISLKIKDKLHLEKFKEHINATYPIKEYTSCSFGIQAKYARILMTSEKMFDDLNFKGATERKSLILKFPNESIVPPHLIHHFIRGYFDGDGSFAKQSNTNYQIKICGTKEFLINLMNFIGHSRLYRRKKKDKKNNFYISIGGRKQVISIGDFMYNNATIFLERKYKIYLKLKNNI